MAKKAILLVHGVATTAGEARSGIGGFASAFATRGWTAQIWHWGWGLFFLPWFRFDERAKKLAQIAWSFSQAGYEVCGLGHSFGTNLLARASEFGAPFRVLIFLNSAAEDGIKIGRQVSYVLNYYLPSDPVLRIAGIVPHPLFGNLGRHPWRVGEEPRKWSVNLAQFGAKGHGDVLHPPVRDVVAPHTAFAADYYLQAALGGTVSAIQPGPLERTEVQM
jgi:hypothetical protein